MERTRAAEIAQAGVQNGKIVKNGRGRQVIGAKASLVNGLRPFVQGPRCHVLPLEEQSSSEVVQAVRDKRVLRSKRSFRGRRRTFEESPGVCQIPDVLDRFGQHPKKRRDIWMLSSQRS